MQTGDRIGPYEVCGHIATGGMAQVWKVWNHGLKRFEAMKVPLPHLIHDPKFIEGFLREARTAAKFHHPHIAAVYAISDANSPCHFFTMELIEGDVKPAGKLESVEGEAQPDAAGAEAKQEGNDLSDLLERGRMDAKQVAEILNAVAAALDYAHSKGVVHRDVKPSNVMLQTTGVPGEYIPKVVDFGIAHAAEEAGGVRMTSTGVVVGSPAYMSPEQAGSGQPVDYRTDIYSLGVVAFEMLCGVPPFLQSEGTGPMSVAVKHLAETPPSPVELNPTLSRRAAEVLLRALSKDPQARPLTCRQFAHDLSECLNETRPKRKTDTVTDAFEKTRKRFVRPAPSSTVSPPRSRLTPVLVLLPLCVGASLIGWAWKGKMNSPIATPPVTNASSGWMPPQSGTVSTSGASTTQPSSVSSSTEPAAKPAEPGATAGTSVQVGAGASDSTNEALRDAKEARVLVNRTATDIEVLERKIKAKQISWDGFEVEEKRLKTQTRRALQLAESAIALDESNEEGWLQRCRALYYLGNFKEAQQSIAQAKKRFPDSNEFELLTEKIKSELR